MGGAADVRVCVYICACVCIWRTNSVAGLGGDTGQRMGEFATICQWEMQVGSKLEIPLTGARRQLSLLFLCAYVLGFCCSNKTGGSISLFLGFTDEFLSAATLHPWLGLFSPCVYFLHLLGKYWSR